MRCAIRWMPWRREVAEARQQAAEYAQHAHEAEMRHARAQEQRVEAERAAEDLRYQIRSNGWTDLLQTAWGRRS